MKGLKPRLYKLVSGRTWTLCFYHFFTLPPPSFSFCFAESLLSNLLKQDSVLSIHVSSLRLLLYLNIWGLQLNNQGRQNIHTKRGTRALAAETQSFGALSRQPKSVGFNSQSGTCLGCEFGPHSGRVREATNRCFPPSLFPLSSSFL